MDVKKVIFRPIGFVTSEYKRPEELVPVCELGIKAKVHAKVTVYEEFKDALKGLEKFSHIFVIYFLHKVDRVELITHPGPPSVKDLPKVGLFASRSQYRPNPIAVKLVKLLRIEGNELYVQGLDAIDESPVLDIKPYIPGFDRPEKAVIASWYNWLGR